MIYILKLKQIENYKFLEFNFFKISFANFSADCGPFAVIIFSSIVTNSFVNVALFSCKIFAGSLFPFHTVAFLFFKTPDCAKIIGAMHIAQSNLFCFIASLQIFNAISFV